MHSEVHAAYTLTGMEFDPDVITRKLQIAPTKTWRLGDPIQETILRHKHDGWSISSDLSDTDDLEDHMRALLKLIYPRRKQLEQLRRQYKLEAEFACAIYTYDGSRPAIHFDSEIVRQVAELGAEIDIDLFILDEDQE